MTDPTGGRLIAERYRLELFLGQGGMGEVWAGYDVKLDRRVAVKLMKQSATHAASAEDAEIARQRFLREIRAAASVNCPGIPAVYDTGVDPLTGDLYLVMELLHGAELSDLIAEQDYTDHPPSTAWAAAIGAQIAAALVEVHRLSVVHRDIKPRNLFVTLGGIIKILDFGVAALLSRDDVPKLTRIGESVGTPPYMSPEQCVSSGVGPAADVYALGCVLFETFTGRPPFIPNGSRSFQYHHVHSSPPPLSQYRPDVPVAIADLIRAMLAKTEEDRPGAETVYDVLLPFAQAGDAAAVREDLDPTRPFTRPMGATPRRRATAVSASAVHDGAPLTDDEFESVVAHAQELAEEQQFAQATDVLQAAIDRAGHSTALTADLQFRLAGILLAAGSYRRALQEFEQARTIYADLYENNDEGLLESRYYAALCRSLLGENTNALAGFQALLPDWLPVISQNDSRTDVIRVQIGTLFARLQRFADARRAFGEARRARVARFGESSAEVAEIDEYLLRLGQYER
ncbi:serine/threonine-protein kinase [Acrocarpospora sp. B8E8]|uniref:serine/threonine-protein kinase n=1 Tax=Acrocarpospora sp. B8E8 TaxID=3153572 RepID=UPI00325F2ED5